MTQIKAGSTVRFKDHSGDGDSATKQHKLYVVRSIGDDFIRTICGVDCLARRFAFVSEEPLAFTVGDKVRVSTTGAVYTTYDAAAEAMGLTAYQWGRNSLSNGEAVTILSAFRHPDYDRVLFGVQRANGEQYVIGERGVEALPAYAAFKVGDRVRIKPVTNGERAHAIVNGVDTVDTVVGNMPEYVGKITTITGAGWGGYSLKGLPYAWMPQWLELVISTPLEEAQAEIERLKKVIADSAATVVAAQTLLGQAAENLS